MTERAGSSSGPATDPVTAKQQPKRSTSWQKQARWSRTCWPLEDLRTAKKQLTDGIRSRETIGLAKGILMHQESCSERAAFRILVTASQRLNRKVRDVAADVVALAEGRARLSGTSDG